jgi:hypothetical protein
VTEKVAGCPVTTVRLAGWTVITGAATGIVCHAMYRLPLLVWMARSCIPLYWPLESSTASTIVMLVPTSTVSDWPSEKEPWPVESETIVIFPSAVATATSSPKPFPKEPTASEEIAAGKVNVIGDPMLGVNWSHVSGLRYKVEPEMLARNVAPFGVFTMAVSVPESVGSNGGGRVGEMNTKVPSSSCHAPGKLGLPTLPITAP